MNRHSAYEKVSQEKTVLYWQKNVFFLLTASNPTSKHRSLFLFFNGLALSSVFRIRLFELSISSWSKRMGYDKFRNKGEANRHKEVSSV